MIEGRLVNNSDSYEGRFYWREPAHKYYEYDEENNIMWVNIREEPCSITELEVYNLTVANTNTYIANGAIVHNCSAENYNEFGTYNKRSINICWMHRANSLANVYYWNKYYKLHNIKNTFPLYLPRNIAEKIITNHEYNELYMLSHPNI